jgi:hypothetical protein
MLCHCVFMTGRHCQLAVDVALLLFFSQVLLCAVPAGRKAARQLWWRQHDAAAAGARPCNCQRILHVHVLAADILFCSVPANMPPRYALPLCIYDRTSLPTRC